MLTIDAANTNAQSLFQINADLLASLYVLSLIDAG